MTRKIKSIKGDPQGLNASDFAAFVERVPKSILAYKKLQRTSFCAVAKTLADNCDYATGTKVDVTVKYLHEVTGAHEKTIQKVLDLLVELGALEIAKGAIKRENGGSPSDSRRFRKSTNVQIIWDRNDIHYLKGESSPVSTDKSPVRTVTSPVRTVTSPVRTGDLSSEDNNTNTRNTLNEKTSLREEPTDEDDIEILLRGVDVEDNQTDVDARWTQLIQKY